VDSLGDAKKPHKESWLIFVHLPGGCSANLYGQVSCSCDYTYSQLVHNGLRKSHSGAARFCMMEFKTSKTHLTRGTATCAASNLSCETPAV